RDQHLRRVLRRRERAAGTGDAGRSPGRRAALRRDRARLPAFLGDLVRLRLQFASDHRYNVVPFHYVGIVREFPTAPHDSFIVANASYVGQRTGSSAPQTLLVKTSGSPPVVAQEVRGVLGPSSGATVQDIVTQL